MSLDFEARKKTLILALPTGIFYLVRNRYLSAITALVVVLTVGAPILYYLIFIPFTIKLSSLAILTTFVLAFYCLSYMAQVFKFEFPVNHAKGSNRRWCIESCIYLLYALGSYLIVNLELIRDLFIIKKYLHGNAWIVGFILLLPFIGIIFFRAYQLISDVRNK